MPNNTLVYNSTCMPPAITFEEIVKGISIMDILKDRVSWTFQNVKPKIEQGCQWGKNLWDGKRGRNREVADGAVLEPDALGLLMKSTFLLTGCLLM